MKLRVHVLTYARAGFKHKRYMEMHLFLGYQTGVRYFTDHTGILSNYLPLFPPIRNELCPN
jgi:hypothetical protein